MPALTEVSPRSSHPTQSVPLRHIETQDLQRGSPTPKFEVEKPRRRSLSPLSSSSSSKSMYSPPPLTWRTAAQDAMAGIHYTKDSFPSSSFLPPPFSREPVQVEVGERVELLGEVDEYAVRVRVLRTGVVGLIPAWNTEGALERLTRMNTAFNEAATCPVEARALRRRDSESSATSWDERNSPIDTSLTHVHSRCVPFATRVRFPNYYGPSSPYSDCEDDSDDSDSPQSPPDFERGRALRSKPAVFEAQLQTLEKGGISASPARSSSGGRKSVNFAAGERPQVVFRYPSEELVGAFLGEKREGDAASGNSEEDDDEWWWHGWEEAHEELARELHEGTNPMPVLAEGETANATEEKLESTIFDYDEPFPFVFDESEL